MRISVNSTIIGIFAAAALALAVAGAGQASAANQAAAARTAPADGSSPPSCTIKQDPNAAGAPANANAAWLTEEGQTVSVFVFVTNGGVVISRVTKTDITGQVVCTSNQNISWEEFWSNAETQDIVRKAAEAHQLLRGFVPPVSQPLPSISASADVGNSVYIAAVADSTIGSDRALFIAAAKVGNNPAKLNWRLFRIQLISIDGATFCTPSADATVLDPRIGVSPAGRLFVVFDSFDNSTTTGSILDIDVRSLLSGGPAQMQCFTGAELARLTPPEVRDDNQNAYFLGVRNIAAVKRYKLRVAGHVANDKLIATPDINIPTFDFNPAAVQPNGAHLDAGSFEFTRPSVQIGSALWNIHQVGDDGGHAKLRLYKFGTGATDPKMTLTLATLPDQSDDLIAPSFEIDGADAFVTFTRTIAADPVNGKATLMMARGPSSKTTGWSSSVLFASTGQFSKDTSGQPCDTFEFAGCLYGPHSATAVDAKNSLVWGFGEIITNGTLGAGKGSEVNWMVKGIGVPR